MYFFLQIKYCFFKKKLLQAHPNGFNLKNTSEKTSSSFFNQQQNFFSCIDFSILKIIYILYWNFFKKKSQKYKSIYNNYNQPKYTEYIIGKYLKFQFLLNTYHKNRIGCKPIVANL